MLKVCQSIVQIAAVLVCGSTPLRLPRLSSTVIRRSLISTNFPSGPRLLPTILEATPVHDFRRRSDSRKLNVPAHSLASVYYSAGGMIWTSGSYEAATNWPAIGAWVTPTTAPVTATFTSNPYSSPLTETVTTLDFTPNQFLGVTDPQVFADDLWAVSFASTAPFVIDDLTYGTPTGVVGVPKSASWVLMLVGFCGLGFALWPSRKPRLQPPDPKPAPVNYPLPSKCVQSFPSPT